MKTFIAAFLAVLVAMPAFAAGTEVSTSTTRTSSSSQSGMPTVGFGSEFERRPTGSQSVSAASLGITPTAMNALKKAFGSQEDLNRFFNGYRQSRYVDANRAVTTRTQDIQMATDQPAEQTGAQDAAQYLMNSIGLANQLGLFPDAEGTVSAKLGGMLIRDMAAMLVMQERATRTVGEDGKPDLSTARGYARSILENDVLAQQGIMQLLRQYNFTQLKVLEEMSMTNYMLARLITMKEKEFLLQVNLDRPTQ